ncbi:MAG TPA: DUF4124 domain-containing protein, partial [Methylomirabilota bacterium]|nr:DUF4124 domain-containing protein [Methylomirabilota bacterium]
MTGGPRAAAWAVVPSPRRVRAALGPPGALALLVLAVVAPSPAAELWQWMDAEGVVRYTNDPETIPPAFRGGARDVGSPQPRPSTPSAPAGTPPALPVPAGTA